MLVSQILVLATRNNKKAQELQELLASTSWQIKTLDRFANLPEVIEDGTSFEENAVKKAIAISLHFPFKVIADDSGLEVEALGGAPGIYSARYAEGKNGKLSDAANCEKLLQTMAKETNRRAQFRCVLAVAQRGKILFTSEGVCRGKLLTESKGKQGFGYDPLFVPEGYEKTFAELALEIKNQISHRAQAMKNLKNWLDASMLLNENKN